MHRTDRSATAKTPALTIARCAVWAVLAAFAAAAAPTVSAAQDPSAEDRALEADLAAERRSADRARRRGELRQAVRSLTELLDDESSDAESRALRARCRVEDGDWKGALEDARRAAADAAKLEGAEAREVRTLCARELAEILISTGDGEAAAAALRSVESSLAPGTDARDAWSYGRALIAAGDREGGRGVLEKGANAPLNRPWEELLAKARCERALGMIERASHTLVAAAEAADADEGAEPDVLAELASLYFEADGEVDDAEAKGRSPGVLYKQALALHASHEAALLGLFLLHRHNWNRQSRSPHEILEELLAKRPRSIEALLAASSADLDDGQLVAVREKLAQLGELAPKRRETRTLHAALAWIEHRNDDCEKTLAELAAQDARDGRPEREVGWTLNELYRFAEAVPFLRRSVERDPADPIAWTELGRSQANTGDEKAALESLRKATVLAAGRQNAWRHNTEMVLQRMGSTFTKLARGELSFAWIPAASDVLETYLVPFYAGAREELATRYGFTPGPVQIEVFERHRDFSVRSTGFEGFPALGVCFGPVVTAVSPVSELRGTFSWARTSFHEFTHVIHLGLSHNRCPRWITEGLATWEEVNRNPSWTRNLRRELIDARKNGTLIPVRELNRAFRGPRILFAYYQCGLWCQMMIEARGFSPLVRLLEAFDRGLDLDQALAEVFAKTPEEIDRDFEAFVDRETAGLAIEPRWTPTVLARIALNASDKPPAGAAEREQWASDACTLAWGRWQQGQTIDAEQALRRLDQAGLEPPRATFLRAEMTLSKGDRAKARELYQRGVKAGGEDFRVRIALGKLAQQAGELEVAERELLAAEGVFPGYDERELSAELALANLYEQQHREDDQRRAQERWLQWNAGNYSLRIEVAAWHVAQSRFAEAERLYREANDVDPFRRSLHEEWGKALFELKRFEEALREFQVATLVPVELDGDFLEEPAQTGTPRPPSDPPDHERGRMSPSEHAELVARAAECLLALGREAEAGKRVEEALGLDADCVRAKELKRRLP